MEGVGGHARYGEGRPGRTGLAQQRRAAVACAAFGVDPKEPAQKWAGGGRGVSARGAGGRCGRGAWGVTRGTDCSPQMRWVREAAADGTRAAHGEQYREHLAALKYAWRMAWAGVISAASRDSERRGQDSEQRHGSGGGR
jgi:hypothetical protein